MLVVFIVSCVLVMMSVLAFLAWLCLRPMTVSFTFDDGLKAHLTIAAPLLEKYGWRGAFNVCTDFLEENHPSLTADKLRILGLTEHPECRMNWDDARELLKRGHEVYPHSCSHENLEKCWKAGDYDLVKHEIHDSIAAYRDHIGVLPRFFCCPHLGWTHEVRDLIRSEGVEMFNNGRPNFGGVESADAVSKKLCESFYEGRRHIDLMFHGIVAREGGFSPFADEFAFEEVLKVVKSLEKRGKIRVVPYRSAHFGPSCLTCLFDRLEWLFKKIRRVVFHLLVEKYVVKKSASGNTGRGSDGVRARRKRRFTLTREQLAAFEAADPNLVFKPLTEETAEDFKKVVRARFSPATEHQVDILLANPLRKYCSSVGDIAYEMGEPACVQGAMLRRVYYKQTPYLMLNGSMFAKMPNASPVSVFGVMWRTRSPRGGLKMSFGCTAIRASCDVGDALVLSCKEVKGPSSWCGQRVALIHPIPALWTRFRSTHPSLPAFHWQEWPFPADTYSRKIKGGRRIERRENIRDAEFGPLWDRLLSSNQGLLSSRSPDDLRWMYESRLRTGRVVLLVLVEGDDLVGYIVLRGKDSAGKCWAVLDLVAENNDREHLSILMREAVRFLRKMTPAMELSIAGFPSWVQPIIAKVFSYHVKREHNSSLFVVYDENLYGLLSIADSQFGWFCGPADGDAWL